MKVLAYGEAASSLLDWADIVIRPAGERVEIAVRIGDKWARRAVANDPAIIRAALDAEMGFLRN